MGDMPYYNGFYNNNVSYNNYNMTYYNGFSTICGGSATLSSLFTLPSPGPKRPSTDRGLDGLVLPSIDVSSPGKMRPSIEASSPRGKMRESIDGGLDAPLTVVSSSGRATRSLTEGSERGGADAFMNVSSACVPCVSPGSGQLWDGLSMLLVRDGG